MENNSNLKTCCTFKTNLNADSVEWCPHEPYRDVFVCGNYQLFEQNVIWCLLKYFYFVVFSGSQIKTFRTNTTFHYFQKRWFRTSSNTGNSWHLGSKMVPQKSKWPISTRSINCYWSDSYLCIAIFEWIITEINLHMHCYKPWYTNLELGLVNWYFWM